MILKTAWRDLKKGKIYSAITIAGLGIAMAAVTLIFLWVQNEYRFDSYHSKVDRIYRLNTHLQIGSNDTWHWPHTPLLLAESVEAKIPEITDFTRMTMSYGNEVLKYNNALIKNKNLVFVDQNWLEVFDYKFLKGNVESFKANPFGIVLTESRAQEVFGTSDPIGKIIQMDDKNLEVAGVVEDNPSNSSFQFEAFAPIGSQYPNEEQKKNDRELNNFNYQTFLVASNESINESKVSEKITTLFAEMRADTSKDTSLELAQLKGIHFDNVVFSEDLVSPVDTKNLMIFGLIAIFILMIACINYVNLTTARANQKSKEVGIKKIIGASRTHLFWQFIGSSALMSAIAALLAALLIVLLLPYQELLFATKFSLTNNPSIWLILFGTTLTAIVLSGIYPSLLLSGIEPIKLFSGGGKGGNNGLFRKGLVIFQFTFSIVMLMCTFIVFQQYYYLQNKDLGYKTDHVFTFTIPWNLSKNEGVLDNFKQKLAAESAISDLTFTNSQIVRIGNTHSGSLKWEGKDENYEPTVTQLSVDMAFKDFYGIKLASGRWFNGDSEGEKKNIIMNETAVKEFNIPKPVIGQAFEFHGNKGQIVGIVKDFHFQSPKQKITPLILFRGGYSGNVNVKSSTENYAKSLAIAEKTWKELIPNKPFEYSFLEDTYQKMHKSEEKQLLMFNLFGGVVLLISCFGLFGLATFATEVRIKEIGVRKVLGAGVLGILTLLNKEFMKLVGVAMLISFPIAWWLMNIWLTDYAYHIEIQWWFFAAVAAGVMGVTLLTVSYQTMKAAMANPVTSLKSD